MKLKFLTSGMAFSCGLVIFLSCGEGRKPAQTHFTKADSVTETYLDLKDSMLETWNAMIHDDNQKLKAMENLIHELAVSNPQQRSEFEDMKKRVATLERSRYTQKSMGNPDVVQEYDFASNALIAELITIAEGQPQFSYNSTMQKLVEKIRTADQRVAAYREDYDAIASSYNEFLDRNSKWLREVNIDSLVKKPLFYMVSGE